MESSFRTVIWKALVEDLALPVDLIVHLLQAYSADELLYTNTLVTYIRPALCWANPAC